jgi:hypothetical protein
VAAQQDAEQVPVAAQVAEEPVLTEQPVLAEELVLAAEEPVLAGAQPAGARGGVAVAQSPSRPQDSSAPATTLPSRCPETALSRSTLGPQDRRETPELLNLPAQRPSG